MGQKQIEPFSRGRCKHREADKDAAAHRRVENGARTVSRLLVWELGGSAPLEDLLAASVRILFFQGIIRPQLQLETTFLPLRLNHVGSSLSETRK